MSTSMWTSVPISTRVRSGVDGIARAQHAVETATALRTLGFDKAEVKAAIERTRAHVGMEPLPLEQWIKIALSCCPKPAG